MARTSHRALRFVGGVIAGISVFTLVRAAVRRARRLDLVGRVAIVTGGSRGLGLRIAEELGRRGARVAICGRDQDALDAAEQRLRAQGIEVLARRADLGDRGQAAVFVERAALEWDRLDILVNNAGVIHVEPLETVGIDGIEEALRGNFWSAVNTTFAALPHLRARGGAARVVNIVSIGGRVAVPHLLGYSASKFALMGFSEGLAAELGRAGVGVITVIPGLMRTGSFYNAEFGGDARRELEWFSVSASLPLLTVNARYAARRVVRAIEGGERVVHIGLPAMVLARIQGLLPGLTGRMMALAGRFLPGPGGEREGTQARRGRSIPNVLRGSRLLRLGDRAARENNEAPPPAAR